MVKILKSILVYLSGKKSAIASIIGLVVGYYAAAGTIGQNEVILIMGITTILFGSASYATGKYIYNKK